MSRFDRFRSLVRRAGDAAGKGLSAGPLAAARKLVTELAERKTRISNATLTGAVARAEGVTQASVTCSAGRIHVDVAFDDGQMLQIGVLPWDARFAPRGAKELIFRVEPLEVATRPRTRDLVGAIAAAVAHALWALPLGVNVPIDSVGTIVDVDHVEPGETADLLRIDLRTVPAVRELMKRGSSAAVIDALGVSEVLPEDGGLALRLAIPGLGV